MSIAHSVGNGCTNAFADVVQVQSLLNEFRRDNGRKPIAVDGKVGPHTTAAIQDFQQAVTHVVDGRVDPNGRTMEALEALVSKKVFEAALLALVGVISEYHPRAAGIHSDKMLSLLVDSMLNERVG